MIKDSRDEVIRSLIQGILFAGLVVLFSFGDLRNTLITVAGLSVCIIAAFAVMSALGYAVNIITLLALSLSRPGSGRVRASGRGSATRSSAG